MVICATTSAALSRRLATPPCWRVTSDPPTRDREECHAGQGQTAALPPT